MQHEPTVTVKPGEKAYPRITPVVYTPADSEPLILHLLIVCRDWQIQPERELERSLCDLPHMETRRPLGFSRHGGPDCFSLYPNPSTQSPFTLQILQIAFAGKTDKTSSARLGDYTATCQQVQSLLAWQTEAVYPREIALFARDFEIPSAHYHQNHLLVCK